MFHARCFTLPLLLCFASSSISSAQTSVDGDAMTLASDGLSSQPYSVYVAQANGYARCGPSSDYYKTDPLRLGQQLRVFAESDDGWLGIQPPDGSFCWVPATTVDLNKNGDEGQVSEDQTVAWIGTHLGRAKKFLWQVRMGKGEAVTVIGRSEREGPDGPQLWFRIVPPSGEFRWVHESEVVGSSEELVALMQPDENDLAFMDIDPAKRQRRAQPAQQRMADLPVQDRLRVSADASAVSDSGSSIVEYEDINRKPKYASSRREREAIIGSGVVAQASHDAPGMASPSSDSPLNQARPSSAGSSFESSLPESLSVEPAVRIENAGIENAGNQDGDQPGGLLAKLAFLGRPLLKDINRTREDIVAQSPWEGGNRASSIMTPSNNIAPNETMRTDSARTEFQTTHQSSRHVQQVTGLAPMPAQDLVPQSAYSALSQAPAAAPSLRPLKIVPAELVNQVQQQITGANADSLRVILSQLMATQSSAAEVDVVAVAADRLSSSSTDPSTIRSAMAIADRAKQYSKLARRRDGQTVVQASTSSAIKTIEESVTPGLRSVIPAGGASSQLRPFVSGNSNLIGDQTVPGVAGPNAAGPNSLESPNVHSADRPGNRPDQRATVSGQLVQVYSARPHSPPYAITDASGRTIAYLTPASGTDLRQQLNSQVVVTGTKGTLNDQNMPHILVDQVSRPQARLFR